MSVACAQCGAENSVNVITGRCRRCGYMLLTSARLMDARNYVSMGVDVKYPVCSTCGTRHGGTVCFAGATQKQETVQVNATKSSIGVETDVCDCDGQCDSGCERKVAHRFCETCYQAAMAEAYQAGKEMGTVRVNKKKEK